MALLKTISADEAMRLFEPKRKTDLAPKRSSQKFRDHPLSDQTPFIVRGLFDASPIRDFRSPALVRDLFKGFSVKLTDSYDYFLDSYHDRPQLADADLGKFIGAGMRGHGLPLYLSEMPTPPRLKELFDLPPFLKGGFEPAVSKMFAGTRENFANWHWDGDYRKVLLYQIFGHKRAYVLPPSASRSMNPVFNFAGIRFAKYSVSDRERITDELGGWYGDIGPGEALYFPQGYWHCLEYLDFTMSINFRFGRSLDEFLLAQTPAQYRGPIALHGAKNSKDQSLPGLAIAKAFFRHYRSPSERYDAVLGEYESWIERGAQVARTLRLPPALDFERMNVSGERRINAIRIGDFDYRVRMGDRELGAERAAAKTSRGELDRLRVRLGKPRWNAWAKVLGVSPTLRDLTNYKAAWIAKCVRSGLPYLDIEAP